MEEAVFYSFKESVKMGRIFFSILLIFIGYLFLHTLEWFSYYAYIFSFLFIVTGLWFLFMNLTSYIGKKPGIYLTSRFLAIRTSMSNIVIGWSDIKSFKPLDEGKFSLILTMLIDNNKTLSQENLYLRRIREQKIEKYKTPLFIVVNHFNVSKHELLAELNYRLNKFGQRE